MHGLNAMGVCGGQQQHEQSSGQPPYIWLDRRACHTGRHGPQLHKPSSSLTHTSLTHAGPAWTCPFPTAGGSHRLANKGCSVALAKHTSDTAHAFEQKHHRLLLVPLSRLGGVGGRTHAQAFGTHAHTHTPQPPLLHRHSLSTPFG